MQFICLVFMYYLMVLIMRQIIRLRMIGLINDDLEASGPGVFDILQSFVHLFGNYSNIMIKFR